MENKYLTKIAENLEEKKDPHKVNVGKAVGGTFLGQLAANIPAIVGSHYVGQSLLTEGIKEQGAATKSTIKKTIRDNNLNVTFSKNVHKNIDHNFKGPKDIMFHPDAVGNLRYLIGPHYVHLEDQGYKKNQIYGGGRNAKNLDVAMHELGHAMDFQKHGPLKRKALMAGHEFTQGKFGLATLAATSAMNTDDRTAPYAVLVPTAAYAPELRSELVANINAYKSIKKYQGRQAANKALKTLGKSFGSYGFKAAGPIVGTALASHYLHRKHEEKR